MSPIDRTVVTQHPLIEAVIALVTFDTFLAYDTEAPRDAPFPYTVVYSLDDALRSGPIWDGQADVMHSVQTTYVGDTAEQARKLMDKGRGFMLAQGAITVTGRSVQLVDLADGGGVERDEDEQPRLFYAIDIWEITTSPE